MTNEKMESNEVSEKLWVADTNFLYNGLEETIDKKKIVLMSTVRCETDVHKTATDEDLRYKARQINRFIFANYDKFHHDVGEYNPEEILGLDYTRDVMDHRIIACAVKNNYGVLTNDLNLYSTAKAFGLEVESFNEGGSQDGKDYTGILKVYVTSDSIEEELFAKAYQDPSVNSFNLLENQYIIFYDKDTPIEWDTAGKPTKYKVLDKFRFDGKRLVDLKLPHKKVVEALNEEQECAIDMLNNDNVPIKFIVGVSGSGKTKLTAKLGIHKILDTGAHSKILAIRNPVGSGENIGYLKGDFAEKTDAFFAPIVNCLKGGELEAALLEQSGQLEKQIPYFAKGMTFNSSYVFVDEAEDLNRKLVKLLGSRLGKQSVIVFSGDYRQAEDKYSRNNGLVQAMNELKGNPLVGIVSLSEDVRSEASKVFSDM